MAQQRVYILSEAMRVSQSPYYMEGTDMQYDIPEEYPLPMETVVFEDGVPVELRCIPSSQYVEKQKQIELEKRSADWDPSDNDRKLVTFQHGRLVDPGSNKVVSEFLRRAGWLDTNAANRGPNTKVIYQVFDEEDLLEKELTKEEAIQKAINIVMALEDAAMEDLYMLSVPGTPTVQGLSKKRIKVHLIDVARNNPDFIFNGAKSARDKASIAVHKAIEYRILTLDMPGFVSITSVRKVGEWEPLMELTDAGGSNGKFDRFVEYLLTDAGKPYLKVIEDRVKEKEIQLRGAN